MDLARIAKAAGYEFQQISAVFSGVADLKKAFEQAKMRRAAGQSTLLFVDEIHRFNRAQQDGFLPFVVRDACGDRHPGPHEANLFDLQAKYAEVISEAQALAQSLVQILRSISVVTVSRYRWSTIL